MSVLDGPGEGTWSVFATKVVEQRDEALKEVARLTAERDKARAHASVMHRRAQKAEGDAERARNAYALPACCADAARARDAAEAERDEARGLLEEVLPHYHADAVKHATNDSPLKTLGARIAAHLGRGE